MNSFDPHRLRGALVALAAVALLGACTSVDLGPRYSPPPIQTPQPLPTEPAPAPLPAGVESQPVPPTQPVPQPLPPVDEARDAQDNLVTLTTKLDGTYVVPPARSGAVGQLDALYDRTTQVLRWKASWTGLFGAISSVQFHGPAVAGQNAAPTIAWPGPFGARYEGRVTLTAAQAADLLAGRWYVLVNTVDYPQGELRGQLEVVQ